MFETVEEVEAFFAQRGVEVYAVGKEGDCLVAYVPSQREVDMIRDSGLQIEDTVSHNGKPAVVFCPVKPTDASGGMSWSDAPDF